MNDPERPFAVSEMCVQLARLAELISEGTMLASPQVREGRRASLHKLALACEGLMEALHDYNDAIEREEGMKPS